MALIIDPDDLNDGTEIVISTAGKTVQLVVAGNLSTDGVTIKCVYSKLKELWKTEADYIKYEFPMTPITDEQFEMVGSWDWADNTTRYLLRTGGWAVKQDDGQSTQEWAGIITLGSLGAADQVYFQQGVASAAGSGAVNFQLQGAVNQAISVYNSAATTTDYRSYLKLFCREWGKSYESADLTDIGVTTLSYQAYRFPLSNSTDIKVTEYMSAMSAEPFSGINVVWYPTAQQRSIGGTNYDFHVIISGDNQDYEDIYQRVQYLLKLDSDIDAGAGLQIGKTAEDLLYFIGSTLYTEFYSILPTGGTYIDDFQNDDINAIVFTDDTGAEVQYPYTATLTLNFGANLVADDDAKYWVYHSTIPGAGYGSDDALLVNQATSAATTMYSRSAAGTAMIQTDGAHGLEIGDGVLVTGLSATGFDGWQVVNKVASADEFQYGNAGATLGWADDTNGDVVPTMTGLVTGGSSVQLTFAYDTNTQGGRTAGTNANVTSVAIGLESAQFVAASGTITRATTDSISLVSALERNYDNPA